MRKVVALVVKVAPSGRPLKVPVIASAPSFAISVNDEPMSGVKPNASTSEPPERATVPFTFN